jgi:YegS/Rv2252/BmrU family lipid kinase
VPRRATLVVNHAAGRRGAARRAALIEKLEARFALSVVELGPGVSIAEAVARPTDLVIASGGDGTVSTVASALHGRSTPLGILPSGTANSLARALDIPLDLDDAIEMLETGEPRTIDAARVVAGRARPRFMVLYATVGLHAETVGLTPRDWKRRFGAFAYVAFGLKKLLDLKPFDVELEVGDKIVTCRANAVTVANLAPPTSIWAQGPPEVDGEDGLLDVTLVAASSALDAIATGVHLLRSASRGEPAERDNVGYFRCSRLVVRSRPAQRVVIDGELVGRTPVTATCEPAALRVIAPRRAEAEVEAEDYSPVQTPPSAISVPGGT